MRANGGVRLLEGISYNERMAQLGRIYVDRSGAEQEVTDMADICAFCQEADYNDLQLSNQRQS